MELSENLVCNAKILLRHSNFSYCNLNNFKCRFNLQVMFSFSIFEEIRTLGIPNSQNNENLVPLYDKTGEMNVLQHFNHYFLLKIQQASFWNCFPFCNLFIWLRGRSCNRWSRFCTLPRSLIAHTHINSMRAEISRIKVYVGRNNMVFNSKWFNCHLPT